MSKSDRKSSIKSAIADLKNVLRGNVRSLKKNGGCYECGDTSHFVRDCPKKKCHSEKRRYNRSDDPQWRSRENRDHGDDQMEELLVR